MSTRLAGWLGAALVAVSALILVGYWADRQSSHAALVEAGLLDLRRHAETLTGAVAEQTRSVAFNVDLALVHVQQEFARRGAASGEHLTDVLSTTPPGLVRRAALLDAQGALNVAHPELPASPPAAADQAYFSIHAHAVAGAAGSGLYIGAPLRDPVTREWLIPFTRALRGPNGEFAGIVKLDVAPEYLGQIYGRLTSGRDDIVALVRQDGEFMSRSLNLANHLGKTVRADRPFVGADAAMRGWFHSLSTHEAVDRMFAWQRLEEWPLVVVVGLGVTDAMAPLQASRDSGLWPMVAVSVLVLALVAGVSLVLRRLAQNVRRLSEAEQRLSLTFAGASELVWEWDMAMRRLTLYGDCEAHFGRPTRELHFGLDDWLEQIHPDDRDAVRAKTRSVIRERAEHFEISCRLQTAAGGARWSLVRGRVSERSVAGNATRITGILLDIDAARRAELLAAQTRESYERLIDCASEGIFVVNARGLIEIFNPAAEQLLGVDASAMLGTSAVDLLHRPEEPNAPETWCPVKRTLTDGLSRRGEQVSYRHRSGHAIAVELNVAPTYLDEAMVGAVVVVQDVSERLRWAAEMEKLARTDALTGVANRRHFIDECEHAFQRSDRDGSAISMLMIDIDHFKLVNDEHGHAAGDAMLAALAAHCAGALRQVDVFGRLGGEEFGACLPGVSCAEAVTTADRLREGVAALVVRHQGRDLRCSISIGVATRRRSESLDQLMARADARLFIAKSMGRNRVATHRTAVPAAALGQPSTG